MSSLKHFNGCWIFLKKPVVIDTDSMLFKKVSSAQEFKFWAKVKETITDFIIEDHIFKSYRFHFTQNWFDQFNLFSVQFDRLETILFQRFPIFRNQNDVFIVTFVPFF